MPKNTELYKQIESLSSITYEDKAKALAGLDREIQNRLDTEGCNIDAIVEAGLGGVFIWESSPEGDTFWRNIVVNLQLDNPPT